MSQRQTTSVLDRSLLEVFSRVYPPVLNHAALVVQHPWTDPIAPLTSIWFHPKLEVAVLIDNILTAWTEKYTMRKKVVQHHTPKRQTSSMHDYNLFHEKKKSNWYICIAQCVCKSLPTQYKNQPHSWFNTRGKTQLCLLITSCCDHRNMQI